MKHQDENYNNQILSQYLSAIHTKINYYKSLGVSNKKILEKLKIEYSQRIGNHNTSNFKLITSFVLNNEIIRLGHKNYALSKGVL